MTLKQLLRGLSTYVPGIDAVVSKLKGTGGTVSSRYCYSLGIGLAGMLTGSNHYHAFDISSLRRLSGTWKSLMSWSSFSGIANLFPHSSIWNICWDTDFGWSVTRRSLHNPSTGRRNWLRDSGPWPTTISWPVAH